MGNSGELGRSLRVVMVAVVARVFGEQEKSVYGAERKKAQAG